MTSDLVRNSLINDYFDNSVLLDTALGIENFLSEVAGIYPYKNWYDGEIIAGPSVKRYWVTLILKYDYDKMPDPKGGMVLLKMGCKVYYKKFKKKVPVKVKTPNDLTQRGKAKLIEEPIWLVKLVIPRKFIDKKNIDELESIDDQIDIDQVESVLSSEQQTV